MKAEGSFETWVDINGRAAVNISASQIYSDLCEIHGTFTIWNNPFKMTQLTDGAHPDQPNGAANIAGVDDMIKHDATFTVKDIVKSVGISSGSDLKVLLYN